MKKYKLIKEYPGSPKLGTVINVLNEAGYTSVTVGHSIYPKRHPEFWEEVVEKDYEILSFKQDSTCSDLWTKFSYGWCRNSNGEAVTFPYTDDGILNNHLMNGIKYNIHSVKRLSDGEVFTVGDVVTERMSDKTNVTIKGFNIHLNKLIVEVSKGSLNTTVELIFLNKVKQLLFTTEDGVDIHPGDKAWSIYIPEMVMYHPEGKIYNSTVIHTSHKYFSTKEKAEEYILMNKPCLSIQDVLDNYSISSSATFDNLKQLVKQKLQCN